MKPIIGITCNYDYTNEVGRTAGIGLEGQDWNMIAGDYIYAIERAGGVPLIIPYCAATKTLEPLLDCLNGILISGGHDINPQEYGQRAEEGCGRVIPQRDAAELEMVRYAYNKGKCIMGICRGSQILNVAMGGTLYQDLKTAGNYGNHMALYSPREYPVHTNRFVEGSILYRLFGEEHTVNSYHHQSVFQPGKNVTITAYSEDGVPEGIEVSGGASFVVGVQWHPEMMYNSEDHQALFKAFVDSCGKE